MSRVYARNDGLRVISGKIKSISDDRSTLVLAANEYNRTTKANEEKEFTVISHGLGDEYKVGFDATVVGYPGRNNSITADAVLVGNQIFEDIDVTVLTGLVRSVFMNEEKTADGAPKMKTDGATPKHGWKIW